MKKYDYARVSSNSQDLATQEAALAAAGCDIVRSEKKTATTTRDRSELATLLSFARKEDVIVVTRVDQLARSIAALASLVRQMEGKGVSLQTTERPT